MKTAIVLDATKPGQKYLNISYRFSLAPGELHQGEFPLVFPVWSPGSYLVREFQNQVEGFIATDRHGKKLAVQKKSKCEWSIAARGLSEVFVSHKIYAGDLMVRAAYADPSLVFCNTPAVFFHPAGFIDSPIDLEIKIQKGWKLAIGKKAHNDIYRFANFDELYDTPILAAAELDVLKFKSGATEFHSALWGQNWCDKNKLSHDLKAIVAAQAAMFGGHPCSDYVFQIIFGKGKYGGLEHSTSSTNMFDGTVLGQDKEYKRFLALLSHEHFHLWNIKRIRPRELGPFDYTRENLTRELWVAEGVTSYYDDHFVLRAGIFSEEEYLNIISSNVCDYQNQKAHEVNSLSDSSYDAWIRHYRRNENDINTTMSYYLKGGLVAMILDWRIIRATSGRKTLDDVMRALFALYKKRPHLGFSRQEFWQIVDELSPNLSKTFVRDYIDGVAPIAWTKEAAPFGLEWKTEKAPSPYFLGATFEDRSGKVFIRKIVADSAAFAAGLQPGDEILAVNNDRIESTRQLDSWFKTPKWELVVARMGRINTVSVALRPNSRFSGRWTVKKGLTPAQKRLLKTFLRKS